MTIERMLRAIAGFFILTSVTLGHFHHPYWFFFTAFVGLNLFQFAFSNFCPMVPVLKKIGFKE